MNFVPYEKPFKPVAKDHPAMLSPSLSAAGIRVETNVAGSWRCANCNKMQVSGSTEAWVDDSVHIGDPWETVIERHRLYNAMLSAWCMDCANKLLPAPARIGVAIAKGTSLLQRFLDLFHDSQRRPVTDVPNGVDELVRLWRTDRERFTAELNEIKGDTKPFLLGQIVACLSDADRKEFIRDVVNPYMVSVGGHTYSVEG